MVHFQRRDGRARLPMLAVAVALGIAAPASGDYLVRDLGALAAHGQSYGWGINEAGEVVGATTVARGMHAFLARPGGAMIDLGTLSGGQGSSRAAAIGDSGVITGASTSVGGFNHAFRIVGDGAMVDLGTLPGGWFSEGTAVNAAGQIAGFSATGSGQIHAFVTGPSGTVLQDLGTLAGGSFSRAYGLNDLGQVAGVATTASGAFRAFRTGPDGMVALGTLPGGTSSFGLGIGDDGSVIGYATGPDGRFRAFVAEADSTQLRDLGTLSGGLASAALGINNHGEVVGRSEAPGGQTRGFLWSDTRGMVDLNLLIDPATGWVITEASAINDRGQIAGTGVRNGLTRAVLLTRGTPVGVPEPAGAALLAVGLAAACAGLRPRSARDR